MFVAISTSGIGCFVYFNQYVNIGVEVLEIVQLIEMRPGVGKALGGGIVFVDDVEGRLLLFGMRAEVSAYQVAIPLPVIFTIRRGMDADETAAMMDIFLQGFFFFGAENLTGWVEEDEGSISAQDLRAEPG